MARYIDLDEAIKHLQFDCKAKYPLSYCNGISAAINEIGKLPAADVVPKREYDEVLENWKKIHDSYTTDCIYHYNKGLQEVAREIIDEFMSAMRVKHEENRPKYGGALALLLPDIEQIAAELKKKYTEGE